MSKPARPTLSTVLPSKGAATRPEPLPEQTPGPDPTKVAMVAKTKRIPITMKLSEAVYERLREASFREKTDKQDLADKALDELLTRMGY